MDNMYVLLNNVSVDTNENDCCELTRAESKRIQAHVLGQSGLCCWRNAVVTVCIVMLLTIVCAVGFKEEIYAQIKVIFSRIESLIRTEPDSDTNTRQKGQWVKGNDCTVTLYYIMQDKDGVSLSMIHIFDKPVNKNRDYMSLGNLGKIRGIDATA